MGAPAACLCDSFTEADCSSTDRLRHCPPSVDTGILYEQVVVGPLVDQAALGWRAVQAPDKGVHAVEDDPPRFGRASPGGSCFDGGRVGPLPSKDVCVQPGHSAVRRAPCRIRVFETEVLGDRVHRNRALRELTDHARHVVAADLGRASASMPAFTELRSEL